LLLVRLPGVAVAAVCRVVLSLVGAGASPVRQAIPLWREDDAIWTPLK